MTSTFFARSTRESLAALTQPTFWLIIGTVTIVCFLSGPFGTHDAMPMGMRLIYWAMIVFSCGFLGSWTHRSLHHSGRKDPLTIGLVTAGFALCVSAIVVGISAALLTPSGQFPGVFTLSKFSFPLAALIFLALLIFNQSETPREPEAKRPAILERLEKTRKAQQLYALIAQDHYVEVVTELGAELCLMRLNDAVAEAAPVEGLQIHRSHWVALEAIETLNTGEKGHEVRLTNGAQLRVSQSRLKELRAALAQSSAKSALP